MRQSITRMRKAFLGALAVVLAVIAAGCGMGERSEYVLHYTTYSSASSDQSITVQRWAEEVEALTDGAVTVQFHYSQSLVNADESVQATLDGRADLAQVGSIYASSDLPMFTAVELPFEVRNPQAHMRAIARLYSDVEEYRADFDRQGVIQLYPLPLGTALIALNRPAHTPGDLAGRSIRSGGLISEVLLAQRVNPVAMTATDIYEGMERGIVDGYSALALANLATFGLTGVSPYVIDPGIGAYSSSVVVIRKELFEEMPPEYQQAILTASEKAIDFGLEELDAAAEDSCQKLINSGTEFITFSDDDVAAWAEGVNVDADWVARNEKRGYDAQAVLDGYREILREEIDASDFRDPFAVCVEEGDGS